MKKTIITLGTSAVLSAALFLTGCETAPTSTPTTTSTPVAATTPAAPATPEAPKFDAMATSTKIKDSFTAIKEAAAKKDFVAATTAAGTLKDSLSAMVTGLPASKAMVDPIMEKVGKASELLGKKDAGAFKMLTDAGDMFGKIDLAKLTAGGMGAAAAGALGGMMDKAKEGVAGAAGAAADKAKAAGSAAAGAAAGAAEKAAGAVEKGAAAAKDAAKDAAKH